MIEAFNIHKTYTSGKKSLQVLRDINLNITRGSFVAITGPSGAGKSTLLHILGGLDEPTKGSVILDEEDIYKLEDSALARRRNEKIGFVFQFYHLLPEFNVLENVFMPALISGRADCGKSQARQDAPDLLRQVGLSGRADHFPSQLSGGEKQRVAIARALINKPELLLCDEPTGNLDSKTGHGILELIKKTKIENQMTVVMVTHNIDLAKTADVVFHLEDGLLVN
jgi:ABC-type lipoprotein export system ATPase subunit